MAPDTFAQSTLIFIYADKIDVLKLFSETDY